MPLAFAPRPLPGEGMSSWVARLAAHNFVTPENFWRWLGRDDVQDLGPATSLISQLASAARLPVEDLRERFGPNSGSVMDPLAVTRPISIRGAVCRICCRAANEQGRDHAVSGVSASLWRFTCPEHRVRLTGLDGFRLTLEHGRACFSTETSTIGLGAAGGVARPAGLALAFEDTVTAALNNRPPGSPWLPRTAAGFLACVNALIDVVLWRRGPDVSFAHEFDEIRIRRSETVAISSSDERRGVEILASASPRDRMNVFAAIGALLTPASARNHPMATQMGWDRPGGPDLFDYFVEEFLPAQRAIIAARLPGWPECIATPFSRALAKV